RWGKACCGRSGRVGPIDSASPNARPRTPPTHRHRPRALREAIIMANRRLIQRYILKSILPYILISLVLFTSILFAQQTVRNLEAAFQGLVPMGFVYGIALAVLPTVLIFTVPMSVLSGTIIGMGRMGSDSELVAIRA